MQTFIVDPTVTTRIATTDLLLIILIAASALVVPVVFDEGYRERCDAFSGDSVLLAEGYQCVLMQTGETSGQASTGSVPETTAVEDRPFEAHTGEW